jgi:hypothetical protein
MLQQQHSVRDDQYDKPASEITIDRHEYRGIHSGINSCQQYLQDRQVEYYESPARHQQYRGSTGPSYRSLASNLMCDLPRQSPGGETNTAMVPGYTLARLNFFGMGTLEREFKKHAVERAIATASAITDRFQAANIISQATIDAHLDFVRGSPAFNRMVRSAAGKAAVLIRAIKVKHPKAKVSEILEVLNGLPSLQVDAAVAWALGEENACTSEHQNDAQADPCTNTTAQRPAEVKASGDGNDEEN